MQYIISYIKTNNLSRRYVKLMINTCLQVLIKQCLKLFVLLIQQASLLDQVLSVNQESVILG